MITLLYLVEAVETLSGYSSHASRHCVKLLTDGCEACRNEASSEARAQRRSRTCKRRSKSFIFGGWSPVAGLLRENCFSVESSRFINS